MWASQATPPEEQLALEYNPAQLTALRDDTDVVTLQIGGNDIGFVDLALTCGQGSVTPGVGCQKAVADKKPFDNIELTRGKIRDVLVGIHKRSPHAEVYVLGYPGIFKMGESAYCPAMGALPDDALYLRSIQEALNAMIRDVTGSVGTYATYVDVYEPSAGHTACDLPALRWVEPIVPVNAAYPVHPNLGGMTAIRDLLVNEIWPSILARPDAPPSLPAPPDSPLPL
jgi:lysophospholipase L1-like esterase